MKMITRLLWVLIFFIINFSCKDNTISKIEPPQPVGTIKGTIELPIKGSAEDIIILVGDQEITVSNKSGRTTQESISGNFFLKTTTDKTQLLIALNKKTLEPIALQIYNPKLEGQLKIDIKSTVDAILKQHPLLQTNDPEYDLEFNKILASLNGIGTLYTDIENLYKTLNPTSGFATIADILPLIGFSKIPLIWQELEEKFFSKWNVTINDYKDAYLDNHNIPTNKQFMTFQVVNPLGRYLAYSVKRGKNVNKVDENIEDSFTSLEFIGPAENIGLYYTRDWIWNLRSGKAVTPQTEKGNEKTVNIENFDYADVYLYSLGKKVNEKVHPQDKDLFIYAFAVNSLDIGITVFESFTQIKDFKKTLSQTLKGRGRNAKEPLKKLLTKYAEFIVKERVSVDNLKDAPSYYWNDTNFKMSKFINESIQLTAKFLSEESNRKLLFDYIELEFGRATLDVALKSTGKLFPYTLALYTSWKVFETSATAIDKIDAFVSGNMVQKFSRVINPSTTSTNTALKISKTDIIPNELVYLEGNGFTPNQILDYKMFSLKFGNQTTVSGYQIINETKTDANGNFKTWIRLPNKFGNSFGSIADKTLKTLITLEVGKQKAEISCNLLKSPFIDFNDGTTFPVNSDGLPVVSAVGPITLGVVLNHDDYYEKYALKITFPTMPDFISSITMNSRTTIDFYGSPKLKLKTGKQIIKIENTKTNEILSETIFVSEPFETKITLSSNKIKSGEKIICNLLNFSATNGSRYKVSIKGTSQIGDHDTVKLPNNLLNNGFDTFEIKKGRSSNLFEYDELKNGSYEITVLDVSTNLSFKATFEVSN